MKYYIYSIFICIFFLNRNVMGVFPEQTSECSISRDNFALATSQFTLCAINNSRPITICESCVNFYINVLKTYENMSELTENNTRCIDNFINLDRLEVVQALFANVNNLWNKAKCYECFQNVNGSLTPTKSQETIEFNKYFNYLMTCLNRTDIKNDTICPTCMKNYIELNDYFLKISNKNEEIGVCMDIVDLMNNTWKFWSQNCCQYRRHNETVFIISTVMVLAITVLFYLITQWCIEKKSPTIIQQSRFAESVNQVSL